jgi:WhiB family redox-sensing transcriptional regulator
MQKALDLDLQAHINNPNWRHNASCRGSDANLFHPRKGELFDTPKMMCKNCPVKEECLAFAIVNFEKFGIWGGTSEKERRVIRNTLVKAGRLQYPRSADVA